MKERKRRGIVLLRESRFSESVSGGSGEFAVAVVVQHFLEVCASAREAIEISIAFAQRKISVRPPAEDFSERQPARENEAPDRRQLDYANALFTRKLTIWRSRN